MMIGNTSIANHLYEISCGVSNISPKLHLKISNEKNFLISVLGTSSPTKWLAIKNSLKSSGLEYELIELNAIYFSDDVKLLKQFLTELEKICGCIPTANLNLLSYKQRFVACLDILKKIKKYVVLILLNADKCIKAQKRGKVSKQVFLYTLMDSIAIDSPIGIIFDISDLLFTDKLEKRVKSRFISNYEFVTPLAMDYIIKLFNLEDGEIKNYYDTLTLHGYKSMTVVKQIFYSKLLGSKLAMPFSQKDCTLNVFSQLGIFEHLILICLVKFHLEMKSQKTLYMIYDEVKRLYNLDNEQMPPFQTINRAFIALIQQTILEWSLVESKTFISIANTPCRFPLYLLYKGMVLNGDLKVPTNMIKWLN